MDSIVNQLIAKRNEMELSVPKLAKEIDIPVDRIYKWEQDKGNPKGSDIDKIKKWLGVEEVPDTKVEEPVEAYNKASAWNVIMKLAESNGKLSDGNKELAEANKIIADANQRLARSNEVLVLMAKTSFENILQAAALSKEIERSVAGQAPLGDLLADKMNMKKEDTAASKGK